MGSAPAVHQDCCRFVYGRWAHCAEPHDAMQCYAQDASNSSWEPDPGLYSEHCRYHYPLTAGTYCWYSQGPPSYYGSLQPPYTGPGSLAAECSAAVMLYREQVILHSWLSYDMHGAVFPTFLLGGMSYYVAVTMCDHIHLHFITLLQVACRL